jgi:putative membrane protein
MAASESVKDVKDSAHALKDSAQDLTESAEELTQKADRRNELTADRTVLAAERTYAAWVRTGLAALASGIGAKKLLEGMVPNWMTIVAGSLLILFSAFCFGAAVWRQLFGHPPQPDVPRMNSVVLMLVNGFLGLVALTALFTIWFGTTTAG